MQLSRPQSAQPLPPDAVKVFSGIIFNVYQWQQQQYDGTVKTFEKAERRDCSILIAATEDNRIIITHQEQPGKEPFMGMPGGGIEPGEDPYTAAKRELLEETGYGSDDIVLYDAMQPSSKIECVIYIFFARSCRYLQDQHLDSGEKISIELVSFDTFIELALNQSLHEKEIILKVLAASRNPDEMQKLREVLVLQS